ncbi:MAG: methyltransferase domain-containing protein [Thiothrix sp.]|uniref:class I SAM-dependent methyltransferase n=1 Tax=Thiothrix sp. TaxID=1032 RepID=UPI002635EACF|nr:methyltransferase domain-containing protein [Thiothrix sp.]MDD5393177.1 methyltransferase domain-containing protein [Thiothrix sp.]
MDSPQRAAVEFSLAWQSEFATHTDRFHVSKLSFWRDILPPVMERDIQSLTPGSSCAADFAPGELVPAQDGRRITTFPRHGFASQQACLSVEPCVGRFYPQGYAWEALHCYKGDFRPFRVIGAAADKLMADPNHPLARYPLRLRAYCVQTLPPLPERGGMCSDIAELVTEKGPGMQAPYPAVASDFYRTYPFTCLDGRDDGLFYAAPRMVRHLDATAIAQVTALYARLLQPGMKVLDLMSSCASHLPETLEGLHVTGLGMNQAELSANPRLQDSLVHDLNQSPALPFADNAFDAVICTVSVEYLTQPLEVMRELARVTQTGGLVIMTFSTRWFPSKVISLWTEMHPFERQGLVLDYFLQTGRFTGLHTESIRGLLRPENDPHYRETAVSDPVFAVWGCVSS